MMMEVDAMDAYPTTINLAEPLSNNMTFNKINKDHD